MAARKENAGVDYKASYNAGLAAYLKVSGTISKSTTERNTEARVIWTSAAGLMADGTFTPEAFYADWYGLRNRDDKGKAKKPDTTSDTYDTRVRECRQVARAAQTNLQLTLECWPAPNNEGKMSVSRAVWLKCCVIIHNGKMPKASAAEIIAAAKKQNDATFLGGLEDARDLGDTLRKAFREDWHRVSADFDHIEKVIAELKAKLIESGDAEKTAA